MNYLSSNLTEILIKYLSSNFIFKSILKYNQKYMKIVIIVLLAILFINIEQIQESRLCVHNFHHRVLKDYSIHTPQKYSSINNINDNHWHPSIIQFQKIIESNPILRMLFQQGMAQCKRNTTLQQFLTDIQDVLVSPPPYVHSSLDVSTQVFFADFMITDYGFQFFRHPQVNQQLKRILTAYSQFLSSSASAIHLNDREPNGWFCKEAFLKMKLHQFKINPQRKHYGFDSWNDFFIRQFKQGLRPINEPQNSKIIINSCQSTPFSFSMDAKKHDRFWLKNQPYSIYDIFAAGTLNKSSLADRFIGGTVYQGYLDLYSYHRWHAPITGIIEDIYLIQGTYYSQLKFQPIGREGGQINSQGYLTATAVRLIIVIKADDQALKSVACVYIGMAEVSSCISTVRIGDHVRKGDQLGYFQFGGSSHCLIFEKGVIKKFIIDPTDKTKKLNLNVDLAMAN